MDRAPEARVKAALVLRRAAVGAFAGALMVLAYVRLGADVDVRPAMTAVVLAMLAVSAPGVVLSTWFRHRCTTLRPAAVVTWSNMIGSAGLAYLDGGVDSPMGFIMLAAVPLVAIVMSRTRLVRFAALTVALYVVVVVLADEPPAGYVFVHVLAFGMLTVVSAHHAEALRVLRRRLARLAAVDPLTGCLNRGAFDRQLAAEIARAGRRGEPVSLVLLDLDGFKRVNDTRGHGAGDDLLAWVGRTLRASVRPHDVVGRIGGDEFAVLLTEGADDVPATAERLRDALAERIPSSAGHATWPEDAADEEQLRHRADERLYADKGTRTGRGHGADAWSGPRAEDPAEEEDVTVARGRWGRLVQRVRSSSATVAEDRWRLTLVQIGSFGGLSCAVALVYVLAFAERAPVAATVVPCVVGMVVGALAVVLSRRLARVRVRRLVVTALNAMNIVLVLVVAGPDGGVHSPLVVGILNSVPLVALSAPVRVAVPHIGVLLAAYGGLAAVVGVEDWWWVASHMGVYLSLAYSYGTHARAARQRWRELRRASRSDALTGCLNRRGFEERFAAALARSERTGAPVSLLVLDLDGFKAVNDTRGHAAGDELLRWVGQRLRAACRVCDSVCRLGGDEFAVVLPDTDAAGAERLAARLRETLAERISASVGTATRAGPGETHDDVLGTQAMYVRADRALYVQKAQRDCTDRRPEGAPV